MQPVSSASSASSITERQNTLQRMQQQGTTPEEAMAFFDALPAASIDDMYGTWHGEGLPTQHPLDGLLEKFHWYGKRFTGPDDVHPLLFGAADRLWSVNPAYMPMLLIRRYAGFFKSPIVAGLSAPLLQIMRTKQPHARLRMIRFREHLTASMIYDALPIQDIFVQVDTDTRLGVMDLRGDTMPHLFFFVLRRVNPKNL